MNSLVGVKPSLSHHGSTPIGRIPRTVVPVEGPQLLVKRIAARVRTIGGRGIASGRCKWREGAGDPVQQGVEGCSSGAME